MCNRIIILIMGILLLVSQNGHTQYDNVWAFGYHAGIDFNSDTPKAIETNIDTREGCASICDTNGYLLFYTDGTSVWDRHHNLMPNCADLPDVGLNITWSTSQSTIIVPMPGDMQKYYIFSLGMAESFYWGRLYYSIIDMTLNNGLGDVIPNSKGVLLDSLLTEHMTAVSGNNCDIWVLVVSRTNGKFKAYNIGFNGINVNPIVSSGMPERQLTRNQHIVGGMDITTDRRKLAIAHDKVILYDFDPEFGKVANPVVLLDSFYNDYRSPLYSDYTAYYGLSFSPDNSKVYTSLLYRGSFGLQPGIYQFDLSSGDSLTMVHSRTLITDRYTYGMKKGPDGKIYCSGNFNTFYVLSSTLNVIDHPNLVGAACQYRDTSFTLVAGTGIVYGFPNYATIANHRKVYHSKADTAFCTNNLLLQAVNLSGMNYVWNDSSIGPIHNVISPGTYWVSYQVKSPCLFDECVDTFKVVFDFSITRKHTMTRYTAMCSLDTIVMEANNHAGINYTWNDGSKGIYRTARHSGTYWVSYQIDSLCEEHIDSFVISYPEPDYAVSFIADSLVCINDLIHFSNTSDPHFNNFHWSFGDQALSMLENPQHAYTQAGIYEVRLIGAINDLCRDTLYKTIVVDSPLLVPPFQVSPESICTGQSLIFSHPMTSNTISRLQWQFGDGATVLSTVPQVQHAYEVSGVLPVTLSAEFRACPESSFTDTVYVYAVPKVSLCPDSFLCLHNASITISNQTLNERGHYRYLWSTGETTESIRISDPGVYSLTLTNHHNCSGSETVTIKKDCYIDIPNAFTPNGDDVNDYFFPRQLLSRNMLKFKMQVLNRWGQVVFETTSIEGRGWDGKFNGEEQPKGVYIYWIDLETKGSLPESYRGNVTLIR